MRKILLCFILLIGHRTYLPAQPGFNQPFGSESDYKRLWYLNVQYIQSWLHSDTATYDTLLWAEDFVHQSGGDGRLYTKRAIMPIFGEKRFADIAYFYADNTMIRFITGNAAMVFSRPPYRAAGGGRESISQYNDVYVKRDGKWICVSANITPVTDPGAPLPGLSNIPAATRFVTLMHASEDEMAAIQRSGMLTREMFQNGDDKKAAELLDQQFLLLDTDGRVLSRKEVINRLKKKAQKDPRTYTVENLFVRLVAADLAMVHGAMIFKSTSQPATGVQFNDIFVKRGKVWKCVSSNNTPIRN